MNIENEILVPLDTDHRSMVVIGDPDNAHYRKILPRLEDLMRDAPEAIRKRFANES
jgi:hypothetical protein